MVRMIFVSLLLFEFVFGVNGAHFLGGTITWRVLNASATGTPVAIVITQTYLWSYSLMPCTNAMIASNQLVPSYASVSADKLNCIANCGSGSTGYSSPNVIPSCADFSSPVGSTVGQRLDTVYLQTGDDFSVAYQDNAWRPLATIATADWSISSRINVKPRSDNGLYNSAPVATIMSPINIPINQLTVIHVPIGDVDGDTLRCRWSTNSNGVDECGGVCPPGSLPSGTVIYPNCTIIITGQTFGDWFAVTLMVEDFINLSSTTPLSSTPVQFLVHVVASATCSTPPEITGEPIEDSCIQVQVGQTFSSQLIAINKCGPSVTIDDIATLSFSGMVKGTLTKMNSTTYYKNLTWTPTTAQIGYQVMCAMAFDSQASQSAQYCFKFYVSADNVCFCPGPSCTTTTTSTTSITTTTTSTTSTTSTTTSIGNATMTSITSTTLINSVSTISSSKANDFDLIKWIVIGAIAGISLLLAFIIGSCLCWYYCSLCGIGRLQLSDCQGPFEFYHIESINQAKFLSFNAITPDTSIESTQRKNYGVYDTFNGSSNSFTDRSLLSNNSDGKKNLWFEDEYTTKSIKNKWFSKDRSNKSPIKNRTVRKKPNRVTIFSFSSGTSTSTFMDSTNDFQFS